MNDLDAINSLARNEDLKFGLSTLHCWIRCFECVLHIGYIASGKNIVDKQKAVIQERFRIWMSLLVDIPMQGSGHTNSGNTARRFFEKCQQL